MEWLLSGFGDEISPDLNVQVAELRKVNISYIDFRGVWNTNVIELSDEQLATFKQTIDAAGMKVSSVASPIGKVAIASDFAPELERMRRALAIAHLVNAPYVRIFSYFLPETDDPAIYRDEVISRVGRLVELAAAESITLIHENERGIYGETPERCFDLVATINSPHLQLVWDPANFLHSGIQAFPEGYELLRSAIAYVHVKDYIVDKKQMTPAGEGEARWPEMLAAFHKSQFSGFFSLEPHLQHGGAFGGFSGPASFQLAATALQTLIQREGVSWR